MDYIELESAPADVRPKAVAKEWYLKGFKDGYRARRPAFLLGAAREQYKKGYAEGLAAASSDFADAIRD
jgi:hypothetical protein